jgi:hypothetical protein
MKTLVRFLLCFMLLPLFGSAQDYEQIPFKAIREIADRNAQALWGDAYPAEPIPYYGFDDEIIAWRFNYSIGKLFPEQEVLAERIGTYASKGDKYQQWGGEDFGRILISARSNMPVLLEYSRCLSAEYALEEKLKKLSAEAFNNEDAASGRIYYLNHFNTWHERSAKGQKAYVCTSPTGGIISETEFLEKKTNTGYFCKTGNFKDQWETYKNGYLLLTDADKYIPYHECMPYYDWSYGCSPTAATMLLAWYDNRSQYVSSKYSWFVNNHFQRYDTKEKETDYNVANLQRDLALAMSTDTLTGLTQCSDIDNGIEFVANDQCGYSFEAVNRYTFLWTRLKNDIDDGKPPIVSIPNHSTAGVGYNDATDMVITHYTHDPPRHLVWVNKSEMDMLCRVSSGGQKGSAIKLTTPFGDARFNRTGQGEVYSEGNWAEIKWVSDAVPGSWVDLLYSTNGGHNYSPIVTGTENDGLYDWLIPAGTSSASCRVIAYLRTPDMEPAYAGADGSWSNFTINNAGAIPVMVSEHPYFTDSLSRYYHFQHTEPSWAVIGAKSDFGPCNWEIQLFNNSNFNQTPAFYSTFNGNANFMVVDGNHYSSALRGIKIRPLADHRPVKIEYEGGNENLVFGSNGPYAWGASKIVEMKEIHLAPGRYYFELETNSGWPDFGMAIYGSTDGQYLRHRTDYKAFADYTTGNGTEFFNVTITQEDDYGLCIFSNRQEAGSYTLKIADAFIWTGAVSTNWHEPDNWSGHAVPDITSKVVITGDGHKPHIINADAVCAKLDILHDGKLYIDFHNLTVNGNVNLNGWLLITNGASRLAYYGHFVAYQNSYLELAIGSGINAYGNWTFEEDANIQLNRGFVDFKGTGNSIIYSKSEDSWFYDLKFSKTGGAWAAYDNCIGSEPLHIKNQFVLYNGATFIQYAMHDMIFDGPFLSYAGSHFYFQNGKQRFEREGTGGISIFSESGSYFNDMVVSVGDWLGLSSNIEIRGDLLIEDGIFKTNGRDIYLKGDFTQNSGFDHGNAKVVFNGAGIQSVNGVNFWRLELNKAGGELRFSANQTNVQQYDWVQGNIRVNGGEVYFWDLEDPGIYGTVIVSSGRLDMRQDPGEFFDLNGNLQISGGEMNIVGGNGDSYWPWAANASFTMSDGMLDFNTHGLNINNSTSYSLTETITGGVIRINGNLAVGRTDFNPAGGTFEFYGIVDDANVNVHSQSNLYHLLLTKATLGKAKGIVKTLTATGELHLNGNFMLERGNFEAPAKMLIGGLFINNQSPAHFDELTGEVILDGAVNQFFNEDETFYKLTINKPGNGAVTVGNDVNLTILNKLLVDRGNMIFNPGTGLLLGGSFDINNYGNIYFSGAPGNEIEVYSATKANYSFDVSGGGYISANNTIFSNMDADGIYLHSGSYIDPGNAFHQCTFTNGAPGGTLITWNNGAEVIVQNAIFPANTTGCTYNVRKTTNTGQVFFDEATGPFSGAAFEDDTYARVDWEYIPPMTLPFVEKWNSASFDTKHWVPEGTNWQISTSLGAPAPSCMFSYSPRLFNYSVPLRSHLIDGTGYENISIIYDIRYDKFNSATLEQLKVQVVHKNGNFITLDTYNNAGGSFAFTTKEFDISAFADGEIFYLRFTAFGVDSYNIDRWLIDNIQVYGTPPEPGVLKGVVTNQQSGLPVKDAVAKIEGTAFTATTDESGNYTILSVPPGVYDVSVAADGYESATADDVAIVSGESTVMDFALEPIPPAYCTENLYAFGCLDGDGLALFELRNISNESGCSANGYGDFTALSTDLPRGYAYQVFMRSNYIQQNISLWIDFDDDFEFADSERLLTNFQILVPDQLYQAEIFIPDVAPTGNHRLRVRTNWEISSAEPCAAYDYGEAEDYTIEITTDELEGAVLATVTSSASGEPIENATVELLGTDWTTLTEEEGICIIQWIIPGLYDIAVSADNFEPVLLSDIYVFGGEMIQVEIELMPLPAMTHEIMIPAGWSGLSSYVFPSETNIENIFAPVASDLVILQNFSGMYWPAQNINTFTSWNHHSAYMIKTTNETGLVLSGQAEANKTCLLNNGWTMLPVLCNQNPNTHDLFLPEMANLQIVKEIAGTGVYWPAFEINTLPQLQVGKAYLVKTQTACSVTFPENLKHAETIVIPRNLVNCEVWNAPVRTASSHLIAIPEDVLINIDVSVDDFLGVFTSEGRCSGVAQVGGSTAITVFGDDLTTDVKEGFVAGEQMVFKWYQSASGQESDLVMEFNPAYDADDFVAEGISVVTSVVIGKTNESASTRMSPIIYPNPANGKFYIGGVKFPVEISIFNSQGVNILSPRMIGDNNELDLSHHPAGIYFVTFSHHGELCIRRLVIY